MEVLISFLLHAIKKQKPHHNNFCCLSDTSNWKFRPPVTIDFLNLPQPRSFNNRAPSLFSLVSNQNASELTATNNLQGTTTVDNLRHRKF
ncbi:hypothetical protein R3W88_025405 [Solanum pinnatisectum]|uniref:Uncharacterized protein n=1 Tax=Solanum pinnatisectum TaxID=50273 RepID=A0AAV9M6V9_9SOLN|nr:hypothetical protein R3W88_025405 [Solanum pinnatisectum]